ncbi:MAG: hypothetical protein R6U16_09775 [Desulfotignum sp.]
MDPGHLIATYVVLLYAFLAPLVLFGIFVLFDLLGRSSSNGRRSKAVPSLWEKDPALWTDRDIAVFRDQI